MERKTTISTMNNRNSIISSLRNTVSLLSLVFAMMACSQLAVGQTQTYNTPGTYSFTVPTGVTSITVSAWGAGGAGGGVVGNNNNPRGGGGGEAGSYVRGTMAVTAGTVYTVVVGSGGTGSTSGGTAGTASSFGGSGVFNAIGGAGGAGAVNASRLGAGGNTTNTGNVVSGTSTASTYGGNGGNATVSGAASYSGGGGGSAGAGGNGGNGGTATGSIAGGTAGASGGVAGAAGRGAADDGNGYAGNNPGAGGSGARNANDTVTYSGGDGGDGQVTVTWTCSGPNVSNFATSAAACAGNAATVTITSTSIVSSGNYNVYYNLTGANVTSSPQLATLSFNTTTDIGTFSTIPLTNAGATNVTIVSVECVLLTAGNTAAIAISPLPTAVSASTSASSLCLGGSINLSSSANSNSPFPTVTLLTENFNGANSWITGNASTGGSTAAAAWTMRANGYTVSSETFNSNDNTQFYLTNSDAQGSSGTLTSTTLQSPSFSTVGLSSATLTFYQYYRYYNGGESINVDVSTNGTTWTTGVYTYTGASLGSSTGFVPQTVNLSSYLGQATLYVRFRYSATYDYYWAIDNVSVTGVSSTAPPATFAWTSSPTGYTSSVQNPTGVTPTVATSYTVTATNSYGCKATATTASVAVNSVASIATISAPSALCATGSLNPSAPTVTPNGSAVVSQGWQIENAVGSNSFVTLTLPYTVSFADNGKKIRYTATNSCGTSTGNQVTLIVNDVPSIAVISTPAAVCAGTPLSPGNPAVTANGSTVTSQSWQLETAVGSNSFSNVTLPYTPSYADNGKKVRYTATNGCGTTNGNQVTLTVNDAPTIASILAPAAFCVGGSLNPSTPTVAANGSTISSQGWQISTTAGGGAYVTLSLPYTVAFSDNGKNIRYTATNGCGNTTTNVVAITVNNVPTVASISTPAVLCSGGSLNPSTPTVTANGAAVSSQGWEISTTAGGGSYVALTLPYTVAFADNGKNIRYTATNGCGNTTSNVVSITVNNPSVAPTGITGTATICSGGSTTLTVNGGTIGTGATIQWFTGSCGGASAGTGNSITVSPTSNTTYYVRYTGTCNTTACASQLVTVNSASTAAVLSGSGSICLGSSANLQVAITGGTSPYTVVYSNGVSNTTVSGYVSGSAIAVSPTASTTYTLVSVTSSAGCAGTGNSGSATVNIDSTTSTNGGLSWSNGTPSAGKSVIFDGSTGTIGANFAACSLRLINNATVTVSSGFNVTLNGKLTVDAGSTFTLNNNSNLLQNTTIANSGNIVVKRNSAAIKRLDYTLWSSPVTGQELYAFSPLTFANRFYTYNPSTNNYVAYSGFNITGLNSDGVNGTDTAHAQFASATGYLIRAPWNHPTAPAVFAGTFTGVPNNGTIPQATTSGLYYAVGNPYPSTIDANTFISNNNIGNNPATPGDGLYFWRKTNNANQTTNPSSSYATYTTAGGVKSGGDSLNIVPNGVIQIGEGFIVKATSTSLQFNNGQRVANNADQFLRNANIERHRIWLNLSDSVSNVNQMMVSYMTGATQGIDAAIDGRFFGDTPTALNSIVNNEEFAVQGRSLPFEATDVVPLAFKAANAGNYSIAIDHVDGLFTGGAQAIYLKDNLTNTYHNLATAYSFASVAGSFNTRFEIVYQGSLSNPVFTANTVVIYSQNDGFVVNSGSSIMASIRVFDIRGRLVEEQKGINATQATIRGGLANQVLLVQITSEEGAVVTKKVIK